MSSVKKIIIYSSVSAIIVLLLVIFLIVPFISSIKRTSGEILNIRKDIVSFKNDVARAEEFRQGYEDLKITPEKIEKRLVDFSAPIDLIGFLEILAQETGLSVDIFPISLPKKEKQVWDYVGISVESKGSFPEIMRFLGRLESGSYFIKVEKFYARQGKLEDFTGENISARLDFKAFAK